MKTKTWYVYILECRNKSLYTGITNDIQRRLGEHAKGKGSKYTRAFGIKRLLYKERHATKSSALKREFEIKNLARKNKLIIIKGKCPFARSKGGGSFDSIVTAEKLVNN